MNRLARTPPSGFQTNRITQIESIQEGPVPQEIHSPAAIKVLEKFDDFSSLSDVEGGSLIMHIIQANSVCSTRATPFSFTLNKANYEVIIRDLDSIFLKFKDKINAAAVCDKLKIDVDKVHFSAILIKYFNSKRLAHFIQGPTPLHKNQKWLAINLISSMISLQQINSFDAKSDKKLPLNDVYKLIDVLLNINGLPNTFNLSLKTTKNTYSLVLNCPLKSIEINVSQDLLSIISIVLTHCDTGNAFLQKLNNIGFQSIDNGNSDIASFLITIINSANQASIASAFLRKSDRPNVNRRLFVAGTLKKHLPFPLFMRHFHQEGQHLRKTEYDTFIYILSLVGSYHADRSIDTTCENYTKYFFSHLIIGLITSMSETQISSPNQEKMLIAVMNLASSCINSKDRVSSSSPQAINFSIDTKNGTIKCAYKKIKLNFYIAPTMLLDFCTNIFSLTAFVSENCYKKFTRDAIIFIKNEASKAQQISELRDNGFNRFYNVVEHIPAAIEKINSPGNGMQGPVFDYFSPGNGMQQWPAFDYYSPEDGMNEPAFDYYSPEDGMKEPAFHYYSPEDGMKEPAFHYYSLANEVEEGGAIQARPMKNPKPLDPGWNNRFLVRAPLLSDRASYHPARNVQGSLTILPASSATDDDFRMRVQQHNRQQPNNRKALTLDHRYSTRSAHQQLLFAKGSASIRSLPKNSPGKVNRGTDPRSDLSQGFSRTGTTKIRSLRFEEAASSDPLRPPPTPTGPTQAPAERQENLNQVAPPKPKSRLNFRRRLSSNQTSKDSPSPQESTV